jgi:hypothetical protein
MMFVSLGDVALIGFLVLSLITLLWMLHKHR